MSFTSKALWTWDTTGATPTVQCFPSGGVTKSGIMPQDLRNFVTVPLQSYGQSPVQVADPVIISWIRNAEDSIEAETGILLCQSYIASPPAYNPQTCNSISLTPTFSGGYQKQGVDFDLSDSGYDFEFGRARDNGWLVYSLRYKPLRSLTYGPGAETALKNVSFIYPLLNDFFTISSTWFVEDHDYALVRFVPSTNVAMLPLFAMQLSLLGYSDSIPNAIWMQYTAGLTTTDYQTRFSFMKQLVLAKAAEIALASIQGTINLGVEQMTIQIDGVSYGQKFNARGPFSGLIDQFNKQSSELMNRARSLVAGPVFTTL